MATVPPLDDPAANGSAGPTAMSTVLLADAHPPEAATRVRFEAFDGPLALLLALIEARQLDVLTVPLGALTESYLDALAGLEVGRLGSISSFVAVASQLILIKSRALLPRREDGPEATPLDDGVDPEEELRARLILYRAYRDAGTSLQVEALARWGLFRREPSSAQAAAVAGARPIDAPPLDPGSLAQALGRLIALAPPPGPPSEVLPRTVTLTERAAIIRAALVGVSSIVLQELLRGVRDRVVVTVTFLAMLELMKRREIVVEQAEPWGPIVARLTTPEERRATGGILFALDEPLDESLESFA
jgi:segregation and condensation protein A